jgi:hypothetical protein
MGTKAPVSDSRASADIKRRVIAYFAGELTSVDEIAARTEGTPFQKLVWAELRNHSRGDNDQLWRTGQTDWTAEREPGGWVGEWFESDCDCGAVSPGDWRERVIDGLWRRHGAEALAVGARKRAAFVGYSLIG